MRNEKARCEEKSPNPGLPLADVVYSLTLCVNWDEEAPLSLPLIRNPGEPGGGGRWRRRAGGQTTAPLAAAAAPAADFLKGECGAAPTSSAFLILTERASECLPASACSASRGNCPTGPARSQLARAFPLPLRRPTVVQLRDGQTELGNEGTNERTNEGRLTAFLRRRPFVVRCVVSRMMRHLPGFPSITAFTVLPTSLLPTRRR